MSRLRTALLGCVVCILTTAATAQTAPAETPKPRPEVGPAPQWVEEMPVPAAAPPPAGADIQYLLVDRQVQYGQTAQAYGHFVLRLLNEVGVQQHSQVNIDFDPEREKLRIHKVLLRRGSRVIDALASGRLEVLQRERNLERNLLDGSLTFHLLLSDVRVGDILEYSFTTERRDPEWNDRHYSRFTTAWDVPVRTSRLRLRAGADAPLRFALDRQAAPAESRDGPWRVLEWNWHDLPGTPSESSTPSWHAQFPAIEVSQFASWKDVVAPALQLYALPATPGPQLAAQVARIRAAGGTDNARALAAIRFVQDEIRYTGLELGAGAFKPTDPEVVLQRRYGDCKDKTLLAVAMLRALGLEAYPALVSTIWEGHLDERLPSPGAFDHVIVRAKAGSSWYWWDATSSAQGGGIADFVQSDLGSALVVSAGTTGITKFPVVPLRSPEIQVSLVYDLRAGLDAESTIAVTTRYRGRQADSMRRRLRNQTPAELGLQYENYYKRIYAKVKATGEPKAVDDLATNTLTVEERYKGTELFERPDADGVRRFSVDADFISSSLVAPSNPVRRAPLAIAHPVSAAVRVEVRLPEDWTIEPDDVNIEDRAFQYRSRHRRVGNDVFLEYEYTTLADSVPVALLDEHLRHREKARADTHFQFTFRLNDATPEDAIAQLSQRARDILDGAGKRTADQSRQMISALRQEKDWESVPAELRQSLAVYAGAIAFDQRDWRTAHDEMKQGIALSSDGELWRYYVEASSRAGEPEDAADAAATLLERFAGEFHKLTDENVSWIVRRSDSHGIARYRLLTAMFQRGYQRNDGLDVSYWWMSLMEAQLERGQVESARQTLGRVRSPSSLFQVQADNRFEPVRSALAPWQQPDRATDAYIEWLRGVAERNPRILSVALEIALAQMEAQRFETALQTLDAILKRARAADGPKYFTDHDEQYRWILDYRGRVLNALGRREEALAQMRLAREMKGSDLVSQGINLAGMYNDMGRPRDARAELARLDGTKASEYGRQMMAVAALDSAIQLHDSPEAEKQLEYLGAHSSVDPSSYLMGLLSMNRLDAAAEQVTRMLEDPDQQTAVLMAAQEYPVGNLPEWKQDIHRRWRQVLERPEVREAVGRVGRIGRYNGTSPMFGY